MAAPRPFAHNVVEGTVPFGHGGVVTLQDLGYLSWQARGGPSLASGNGIPTIQPRYYIVLGNSDRYRRNRSLQTDMKSRYVRVPGSRE